MKLLENIEDQLRKMLNALPFGENLSFGEYTYTKQYTVIETVGETSSTKAISLMVEITCGEALVLTKIDYDIALSGKLDFNETCDFLNALAQEVGHE